MSNAKNAVAGCRVRLISALQETSRAMLLNPDLNGPIDEVTSALQDVLKAYEGLVKASSSTADYYAVKNLTGEEGIAYSETKHAIKILRQVHGPQVALVVKA